MKPRIKMGQLPGDVSKKIKIAMLEKGEATVSFGKSLPSYKIGKQAAKSFKKTVRMKEKAVLKERARKEIKESLC